MADLGEKIGPLVESLLEPGETLEGMCVDSRQGFMSGKFVVIAATDRRLIVQESGPQAAPARRADLGHPRLRRPGL